MYILKIQKNPYLSEHFIFDSPYQFKIILKKLNYANNFTRWCWKWCLHIRWWGDSVGIDAYTLGDGGKWLDRLGGQIGGQIGGGDGVGSDAYTLGDGGKWLNRLGGEIDSGDGVGNEKKWISGNSGLI